MKYIHFSWIFIFLGWINFSCSKSSEKNSQSADSKSLNSETFDTSRNINNYFEIPETFIRTSPDSYKSIAFTEGEKPIEFAVSPAGMDVAVIVTNSEKKYSIKFWEMSDKEFSDSYSLPQGFSASSIVWHPEANSLFVLGQNSQTHEIIRLDKNKKSWTSRSIYSSPKALKRMVVCPRPFIIEYIGNENNASKVRYSYRLFLGMDNGSGSFSIVSVTETGGQFYQAIGPENTSTNIEGYESPSNIYVNWALPIAFHPAGHQLIWEDENQKLQVANYTKLWENSESFKNLTINNGSVMPIPNGLGFLHWNNEMQGIGLYIIPTKSEEIQASEYQFTSMPLSVPDGKGVVGLTKSDNKYTLNYVPIQIPLADVVNAWMFSKSHEELNLFMKNSGLFRPNHDAGFTSQLYQLYETENYDCGSYSRSIPTRPYMVTTDIFWELFGAAYQGIFIVKEKEESMANFWNFVNNAHKHFQSKSNSSWTPVFSALVDLHNEKDNNPEVVRILKLEDGISDVTKEDYYYSDLKPRGHYTSDPEMEKYFMAFRYFTTIHKSDPNIMQELNSLPEGIKNYAVKWIESYYSFIAPSRSPLLWKDIKTKVPGYCKHPDNALTAFPLSWGFDNEVLYSTVYHDEVPEDEQITGPNGPRILPSGIDLAAALGNDFAESLMKTDFEKYPPLKKVMDNLKKNYRVNGKENTNGNLYNEWINALGVQWANEVESMNGNADKEIWQVKRLQTGLASWATLRHATILVNERSVAECGEGGFEEILLRAPRGYVEPDPNTFAAIADLFDAAAKHVLKSKESASTEKASLYDGIVSRLKEAAERAREFEAMAKKELKGEMLSDEENEKILFVARVAEHLFLVFNSLSEKDNAISNPDPIAKIADVAGGDKFPYLMSAVGNAMEWNHIVPFYGRRQIVKGSVYSYYEFSSDIILNDEEWRKRVNTESFVPWVKPYISEQEVSYPAISKY